MFFVLFGDILFFVTIFLRRSAVNARSFLKAGNFLMFHDFMSIDINDFPDKINVIKLN